MRIFLDTNVIIGAVAARGLCADVMREVLARHELIVCQVLLDEIKAVLAGKIGVPEGVIADLDSLLCEGAVRAMPADAAKLPIPDPADRSLVAAALNGQAGLFVTGDSELLSFQKIGEMAIVSPRVFWERVKTSARK